MKEYTIYGGDLGKSRLDILSSTLHDQTTKFLEWGAVRAGLKCLDLGCGGGHVSLEIANMVGPSGTVKSIDADERKIDLASRLCRSKGLMNVDFQVMDAYQLIGFHEYDLIYSRFLLSHLSSPELVLQNAFSALKKGGIILIEDTDFSGHFSIPSNPAFDRYVSLYQWLLLKKNADANRGQQLMSLLRETGFNEVEFQVSQPAYRSGEGKLMAEITFSGITQSLLDEALIDQKEAEGLLKDLIAFRKQEDSIVSLPRIFQVKAKRT